MYQFLRTKLLQVGLNLIPRQFGERSHDFLERATSVFSNVISQSCSVSLTSRFPFGRLCGCSFRRRIEPFGQDRLAPAGSIQNPDLKQPGHVWPQLCWQSLARCDQSQNQEVVRVERRQSFFTDALHEFQEVLVTNFAIKREPNLVRVGMRVVRQRLAVTDAFFDDPVGPLAGAFDQAATGKGFGDAASAWASKRPSAV